MLNTSNLLRTHQNGNLGSPLKNGIELKIFQTDQNTLSNLQARDEASSSKVRARCLMLQVFWQPPVRDLKSATTRQLNVVVLQSLGTTLHYSGLFRPNSTNSFLSTARIPGAKLGRRSYARHMKISLAQKAYGQGRRVTRRSPRARSQRLAVRESRRRREHGGRG